VKRTGIIVLTNLELHNNDISKPLVGFNNENNVENLEYKQATFF
jgi:hypothetical protein